MLREQQRQLEQFTLLLRNEERRFGTLYYLSNKRRHAPAEFAASLNVPLEILDAWRDMRDAPSAGDLLRLPRHILIPARKIFMDDLR